MLTLILLFLLFRALNPWRWHRPWGLWYRPWGMWGRPPMGGFGPGHMGPRPPMGGFGGPGRGAGRF